MWSAAQMIHLRENTRLWLLLLLHTHLSNWFLTTDNRITHALTGHTKRAQNVCAPKERYNEKKLFYWVSRWIKGVDTPMIYDYAFVSLCIKMYIRYQITNRKTKLSLYSPIYLSLFYLIKANIFIMLVAPQKTSVWKKYVCALLSCWIHCIQTFYLKLPVLCDFTHVRVKGTAKDQL